MSSCVTTKCNPAVRRWRGRERGGEGWGGQHAVTLCCWASIIDPPLMCSYALATFIICRDLMIVIYMAACTESQGYLTSAALQIVATASASTQATCVRDWVTTGLGWLLSGLVKDGGLLQRQTQQHQGRLAGLTQAVPDTQDCFGIQQSPNWHTHTHNSFCNMTQLT